MRILLTGCTGFVGKFVLLELLLRAKKDDLIICLLRGKKGQTAQQRWQQIKEDSLFTGIDFDNTQIKEGDLNSLDDIVWDNEPDVLVHSAANVKTLDPYPDLYRDNVLGVQKICEMCIKWQISRLHLVSTCYVHPRGTVGKSELLSENLPRSVFTTDYTYTKYLGECAAKKYSDKFHVSILRLSCVGAPSNWLDAHPTPGAMAHLGFISLAMRGKLEILRIPSTMALSTIPVNIVARAIADDVLVEELGDNPITVKQICASPTSQWNISIPQLCSTMQRLAPDLSYIKLLNLSEQDFKIELNKHWGYSSYTPWGYKALRFHEEVNEFMTKFADGQRFETSVDEGYFPKVSDEQIYEQTCLYVARGIHQYKMERSLPRSNLDLFWGSMDEHYMKGQIMFKEPLKFGSKDEAVRRIYDCLGAYRPFFADPYPRNLLYNGSLGPNIGWTSDEASKVKRSGQIELLGDFTSVKGFKMTGHHGIGDGISFIGLLPRVNSLYSTEPEHVLVQSSVKSRSLSMTQEIQCIAYYLAALVLVLVEKKSSFELGEKKTEMSRGSLHKIEGKSFTSSLIEKTYPILRSALDKDTIVYCIPAAIEGPKERGLNVPRNSFVPIILPWSAKGGRMQEMCLNSKGVKFIGWLVSQLISITENKWLLNLFMDKVDIVLSSLMASDRPLSNIDSFHILSPVAKSIPFTVSAITIGTETFITCGSSHSKLNANQLMRELLSK
jgi:nucleoside-diphosphate-sugar epimerase